MEQEIEYVIHQTLTLTDADTADEAAGVIKPEDLKGARYTKIK